MANAPICNKCGGTGHGVQFSIFSPHGFGTYCVECEKAVNAQVSGIECEKAVNAQVSGTDTDK